MGVYNPGYKFTKTGQEVKAAITARLADLENRLARRNQELDTVIADKPRLRSFLVRDIANDYPHASQIAHEMPTEDHQRISELCKRINSVEKEIRKLSMIRENLKDEQQLELDYEDLIELGFGPRDVP
jgi:hypothetical protein